MPHRLVTVGYVATILAGAWALDHASTQRSQQKLQALENACLAFGNPGRALDRLASTGYVRMRRQDLQPIVDCHATYFVNEGRPVPLDANEQARFVEWIRRGVVPVIRPDGTVPAPK